MSDLSPENEALAYQRDEEQAAAYAKAMEELAYIYYETFRTDAGQKALKDLRERCNMDNSCVHGDVKHPDPYAVMFQEGKRAVFNHIMMHVRHDNERRK